MHTTTCHYNLLFLSLPRPALAVSVIPQGWQLLLVVIRLPAAKGNASRPYVCCCNFQLLTDCLLRAIVVWIVIIGGRWLLVISYDVMRADDVSAEDLQPLQERLFPQLGPQFKRGLNEFLQFWWVPTLSGWKRGVLSLRCFHKEISTVRKIYRTLSVVEFLGKECAIIIRNGSCLSWNVVTVFMFTKRRKIIKCFVCVWETLF